MPIEWKPSAVRAEVGNLHAKAGRFSLVVRNEPSPFSDMKYAWRSKQSVRSG